MRCPNCQNDDTKVVDSRPVDQGAAIRRRRECDKCSFRFSTYEEIEILDLTVHKRSGGTQPYMRDKLERGVRRAFEKRHHDEQTIKSLISQTEQAIQRKASGGVIASSDIGELVMQAIVAVDKVAYIRFASVYQQFENVEEFQAALKKLAAH
jgi:transcriptional repressor NrdR